MTCGHVVVLTDLPRVVALLVAWVVVVRTATWTVVRLSHHEVALSRVEGSAHRRVLETRLVLGRASVVTVVLASSPLLLLRLRLLPRLGPIIEKVVVVLVYLCPRLLELSLLLLLAILNLSGL